MCPLLYPKTPHSAESATWPARIARDEIIPKLNGSAATSLVTHHPDPAPSACATPSKFRTTTVPVA